MTQPKYQQVAIEIAKRIVSGQYNEGEKLHARSTIAVNFHVSPETARKAIIILNDLGIVESKHGSGVYIISKIKAQNFIEEFEDVQNISTIKNDLFSSIKNQQSEYKNMMELLDILVQQTNRYNKDNLLKPYEFEVSKKFDSATIQELNFWSRTGATIVAIYSQIEDKLIISPGPLGQISKMDQVYFVGDELAFQRVQTLLGD